MDMKQITRPLLLCGILLGWSSPLFGQDAKQNRKLPPAVTSGGVKASLTDIAYGDHKRNRIDLWLVESDEATPLVIYIHGGGFRGGDKSKIYTSQDLDTFLRSGISFASINYRYRTNEALGVRASLYDSKRALQYIRSRAKEWNIDPERIGCYGGSAGAGTSLWLGFNDDLADPENEDPVLRESTRLQAVGATGTQATYDLSKWNAILELEPDPERSQLAIDFYGFASEADLETKEGKAVLEELDMLELMDSGDPPFYVVNNQKGGLPPTSRGHMNHHPLHAKALLDRANEVGAEAYVYAPRIGVEPSRDKQESLAEFFVRVLLAD